HPSGFRVDCIERRPSRPFSASGPFDMSPHPTQTCPLPSGMPAPSASANGGVEPCVIVIFGASGDLTRRKLIPSLYDLDRRGSLPKGLCILGASRTEMSDDEFREHLRPGVEEHASHWDAQ